MQVLTNFLNPTPCVFVELCTQKSFETQCVPYIRFPLHPFYPIYAICNWSNLVVHVIIKFYNCIACCTGYLLNLTLYVISCTGTYQLCGQGIRRIKAWWQWNYRLCERSFILIRYNLRAFMGPLTLIVIDVTLTISWSHNLSLFMLPARNVVVEFVYLFRFLRMLHIFA